jgi:photosystem II stability/assembly factor-like uncharacterized protein
VNRPIQVAHPARSPLIVVLPVGLCDVILRFMNDRFDAVRRGRQRSGLVGRVAVLAVAGFAVCSVLASASAAARSLSRSAAGAQLILSTGQGHGVVVNYRGVSMTADDGARWVNVTPPRMRVQPILLSHTFGIAASGDDHVWLLVSANAGYGTRLVYTSDAGKRWRTTPLVPGPSGAPASFLPGDANPTAPPAFLNANDGWIVAILGVGNRGGLFRTRDGGARWSFVARTPFQGSVVFASETDAWGISAPTWTNAGTVKKDGGVLYHTTDGGVTWRQVQLPPISNYSPTHATFGLPRFFNPLDGVIAGRLYDTGTAAQPVVVYSTNDGGLTWKGHLAPQTAATRRYQQGFFTVPFVASSATQWAMFAGSILYTTTDAGLSWTTIHPRLPNAITAVDHLYSAGPRAMWAQANGHTGNFYPSYLLRSINGGRTWSTLSP